MALSYILWSFGIFFPFWYVVTKKNLATLESSVLTKSCFQSTLSIVHSRQNQMISPGVDFKKFFLPVFYLCTITTQSVPNEKSSSSAKTSMKVVHCCQIRFVLISIQP
jgi:hypothetical protein